MIAAIKRDFETRFAAYVEAGEMNIMIAHTQNYEEAEIFRKEIEETFPGIPVTFADPLSLSVSCHIGPGALAIACARIVK